MIGGDTAKQALQGWLVLAGTVLLCASLAVLVVPDDPIADEPATNESHGQLLAELIRTQRAENELLNKNLAELKQGVGFTVKREFEVPEEEMAYSRQPGLFFHDRRNETIQKLDNRAHEKGIAEWDKHLGFASSLGGVPSGQPPPNEEADDLLLLLQVTKRVVSICLETPTPLVQIKVLPHSLLASNGDTAKLVRTVSPVGRPPLFREYPVSLTLKGTLSDILWVVHRLSPGVDEAERDFPLVLKAFTLTSDNVDLGKPIPQLSITLTVAGISFLTDKERSAASVATGRRLPADRSETDEPSPPASAAAKSF